MYKKFMYEALNQAKISFDEGEVPVGAVVVKNGEIIATGRNRREQLNCPTSHAEIEAINNASKILGDWRLNNCDLYVTLEPCPMCAGAIINARINKVIFGANDKRSGSVNSVISMFDLDYEFHPKVVGNILDDECSQLLSDFFKKIRI